MELFNEIDNGKPHELIVVGKSRGNGSLLTEEEYQKTINCPNRTQKKQS